MFKAIFWEQWNPPSNQSTNIYTPEDYSNIEHYHGRSGRSFFFPNGWFVGSMLIFQSVINMREPAQRAVYLESQLRCA